MSPPGTSIPPSQSGARARWLGVLGPALFAACWAFLVLSPRWNHPDTGIAGAKHSRTEVPPGPPIVAKATVLVIDGLGADQLDGHPDWRRLREASAYREMNAPYPSFTAPGITSMVTGLSPRESGIRLNGGGRGTDGIDGVLSVAVDSNRTVAVRSRTYPTFGKLVRPPKDELAESGRLRFVTDEACGDAPDLLFVHFDDVDHAAHRYGTEGNPTREAISKAARFTDRVLMRRPSELVLVVSDHGHIPAGGHGGTEASSTTAFLMAFGPHVKRAAQLEKRPLRDVASTVSVALGIPIPSSNLGSPMLDLFDLSAEELIPHAEHVRAAAAFGCEALPSPGCAELATTASPLSLTQRIGAERDLLAETRELRQAARRGIAGGALALAGIAALLVAKRRLQWTVHYRRIAQQIALLCIVYTILYWTRSYRPSLSCMVGKLAFVKDAAWIGLAGALSLLALRARDRDGRVGDPSLPLLLFCLTLPVGAFVGWTPSELPHPTVTPLFSLLAPLIGAAALSEVLYALTKRVRRRRGLPPRR